MSSPRIITVMGASGYTGRLVAAELQRRGASFAVAGRDAKKLDALSARLGGVETIAADVRQAESLQQLARRSSAIINCAGPFMDLGEPVVLAAIENGAHYLDTTGEQPFINALRARDAAARAAKVAVVPAMAFEIALTDCAAAVAAEGFTDLQSIQIVYALPTHASQGTQRTALRMLGSEGLAYEGGAWVAEPPARLTAHVELPAPLGRVVAVSFPSAEVITIPAHQRVRSVRAFMRVPPAAALALSSLSPLLPLLGRVASRFASVLVGEGTDGPDERTRAASAFHIAVDVRGVRGGRARTRRLLLRGTDPYGLTAVIAASGAEQFSTPGFDRSGVLAPAQAVEPRPFLDSIAGVNYELSDLE